MKTSTFFCAHCSSWCCFCCCFCYFFPRYINNIFICLAALFSEHYRIVCTNWRNVCIEDGNYTNRLLSSSIFPRYSAVTQFIVWAQTVSGWFSFYALDAAHVFFSPFASQPFFTMNIFQLIFVRNFFKNTARFSVDLRCENKKNQMSIITENLKQHKNERNSNNDKIFLILNILSLVVFIPFSFFFFIYLVLLWNVANNKYTVMNKKRLPDSSFPLLFSVGFFLFSFCRFDLENWGRKRKYKKKIQYWKVKALHSSTS